MASTRLGWTRTAAIVALALTLAACACYFRPSSGGGSCQSVSDTHAATIDATKTPPAGFVRAPVVIHIMTNPQDPSPPIEQFWTPALIDKYFGAGNSSVNQLWRPAGIHFSLIRIERCSYVPPVGTYEKPTATSAFGMLPPDSFSLLGKTAMEQQTIIDHYLSVNTHYGCCKAVNVYLWEKIQGAANGYGESPRRNRPEVQARHLTALPTVWYESWMSCTGTVDPCQRGLAHEFGHALGLRHPCDVCNCCLGGVTGPACACEIPGYSPTACGVTAGCCDGTQAASLMYPSGSGVALCAGEISAAQAGVHDFF